MNDGHVYVFVRRDLSAAQQIVQACHAVEGLWKQISFRKPDTLTKLINPLVLLEVSDVIHLIDAKFMVDNSGLFCYMMFEPDIQDFTAIAVEPVSGEKRDLFRDYPLKG